MQVKLSFFLHFSFFLTCNHESRFQLIRAAPSQRTSSGDGGSSPLLPMLPLPPPSFPRAGLWASGEQSPTCISCNPVSKICQVMEGKLSQGDLEGHQKLEEMLHLQPRPSLAQRPRPQLSPSQPSTRANGAACLHGGWEERGHSFSNRSQLFHLAKIHACNQQTGQAWWEGLGHTGHVNGTLPAGKGQHSPRRLPAAPAPIASVQGQGKRRQRGGVPMCFTPKSIITTFHWRVK